MPELRGRRNEKAALDRVVAAMRGGESQVLVLRGEAGVGKSALLAYLLERASDCHIARASGVESEMELAFAGLHQLCAPILDRAESLPGPQREALSTAFGVSVGRAPDRFMVGLALLSLLAEVAEERPLVCVIDDAQWLDRVSAQTLAFVARRLLAEPIALVFAVREPSDSADLDGLPEVAIAGLNELDGRDLLASALRGPLEDLVRDRIVAETRGNPLALLELPRAMTPAELAGGFGALEPMPLESLMEQGFMRRLDALSAETRTLLLAAAAEPVGDATLLWRALERLGISPDAAAAAEATGLIDIGRRVSFRHPLVRSAVYRAAGAEDLQAVHGALAEVTDPDRDPDRRAWHRAHAAVGPDEDVAQDLERSAGRARGRGGVAAAAAFLERSTEMTPDPANRGARALAAAHAKSDAADPEAALALLGVAQLCPLDALQQAQLARLRAQAPFASTGDDEATVSSDPPTTAGGEAAALAVSSDAGLGDVLVDSGGRTLYRFEKDSGATSACTAGCAGVWPPLRASGNPMVGSGATASQIGTTKRSDGPPQITYNGHPLYTFSGDENPGDANGQGLTNFGALWYVVSPAGDAVTSASTPSAGFSY